MKVFIMFKKILWEKEKEQKIAAIDIDGCLVDYPKCWVDWLNKETGKKYKNLNEAKEKLSYNAYKTLKAKYRTCGVKSNLPLKPNTEKFFEELRKANYLIILLTSRPYRQHREIWRDTIKWLNSNNLLVDGIIWEKEKHLAVMKEFPYLSFMVEDNAEIANQVAKLGYKVYVVDNEYNQQRLEKNCFRITDLMQIIKNEVI